MSSNCSLVVGLDAGAATTVDRSALVSWDHPTAALHFQLSATTRVAVAGPRYLHAIVSQQFDQSPLAPLTLRVRSRPFSAFLLVIGTLGAPDLLLPSAALLVENKDQFALPLILDPIPSAKAFKAAVQSLSPEQARFAAAYRSLQLEGSVLALLTIEVRSALESLLALSPGSLLKEVALGDRLLDLFSTYQLPSDLLSFDGPASAPPEAKLRRVTELAAAMQQLVEEQQQRETEQARLRAQYEAALRPLPLPPPPPPSEPLDLPLTAAWLPQLDHVIERETAPGSGGFFDRVVSSLFRKASPSPASPQITRTVFALVFSLTDASSFDEMQAQWNQLLNQNDAAWLPAVLCGNKLDQPDRRLVDTGEAITLAQRLGKSFVSLNPTPLLLVSCQFDGFDHFRIPYIETSARSRASTQALFHLLARLAVVRPWAVQPLPVRVVMVGSGGVGKSHLSKLLSSNTLFWLTAVQFVSGQFMEEYDPTIEDNYRRVSQVSALSQDFPYFEFTVQFDILDTAGQEEYSAMRLAYQTMSPPVTGTRPGPARPTARAAGRSGGREQWRQRRQMEDCSLADIIEDRDKDLRTTQQEPDRQEVQQLFNELESLVTEQGQMLDNIEVNISNSFDQVEAGRAELSAAATQSRGLLSFIGRRKTETGDRDEASGHDKEQPGHGSGSRAATEENKATLSGEDNNTEASADGVSPTRGLPSGEPEPQTGSDEGNQGEKTKKTEKYVEKEGRKIESKTTEEPEPRAGRDLTKVASQLDALTEKHDPDGLLRPTIVRLGPQWRHTHPSLSDPDCPATEFGPEAQVAARARAFDLLDLLSRSGSLELAGDTHVIIAATHCFAQSLVDTVVQDSVNPVDGVERSSLLVASVLHSRPPAALLPAKSLARVRAHSPSLFQDP